MKTKFRGVVDDYVETITFSGELLGDTFTIYEEILKEKRKEEEKIFL